MSFLRSTQVAIIFLSVIASLAVLTGGAGRSDVGGDPDEPAHAVTSLMVRDYLVAADHHGPAKFAQQYYEDFPKIALGHYPPFYYVVGALILLVAPKVGGLIVLQAVLLAVLGTLVFLSVRRKAGFMAAMCGALMTMLVPVMWKLSLLVMADVLLVLLCFLAVLSWVRFCERPTKGAGLLFGLLAALAILTKGSALMLGAVPPVVLLLRRQWPLLRSWSLWLSSVPVLLLAAPWMIKTAGITKEGMTGQTVPEFFVAAVSYYAATLPQSLGWLWLFLAGAGLVIWVRKAALREISDMEAALLASVVGCLAIILLIPAGLSSRYLAPIVPALALLAVAGAGGIADLLAPGRLRAWASPVFLILALAQVLYSHGVPQKEVHGFSDAVAFVQAQPPAGGKDLWLVSSEARGEGAVIAEAAFRLPLRVPSPLGVLRASKELAASDWMGRGYKQAFASEAEVLAHLDKLGVRWVFADQSVPEKFRVSHQELLVQALRKAPDRWKLERTQKVTREQGVTGELLLYRSLARTGPPAAP